MKSLTTIILAVLCVLGGAFSLPAAEISYNFTIIDHPAAQRTEPHGINSAGDIVGMFGGPIFHGFLYHDGIFTTIDVPGVRETVAEGINSAGQIVGSVTDATGTHGFLLSDGIFTTFDVPGAGTVNGAATRAHAINASGEIVGDYDVQMGTGASTHGYLYSHGIFTTIDFPGAYATQAFGINSAGEIVGSMAFPSVGGDSAFLYSHGTFSVINNPNSSSPVGSPVTVGIGINNSGQIVGIFTDLGAYRGFVYDKGTYTTLEAPEAGIPFAYGINNAGKIVGSFGTHGFLATPAH